MTTASVATPAEALLYAGEVYGEESAMAQLVAELHASQRLPSAPPQPEEVGDDELLDAPTYRTLADVDDTPPQDLLLGMLEPDGPNLMYAAGGTGKGSTFAWQILELQALGIRPLVYDPENRPKEWARRTSGIGVDRQRVVYLQPKDLPRSLFGCPLWDVVPHLGRVAKAAGCGIIYIDSILAGMGIGEERLKSDAQAPYLYVQALDQLGIPSVSSGHTPRSTPEGDPYGSVSWVNSMRLTWLGTPAEGEGHCVRWRPRKRNERGHIAPVLLSFTYSDGKRLSGVHRQDDDEVTREWVLRALRTAPRTVEELAEEALEMGDTEPTASALDKAKARVRQTLNRMKKDGQVTKSQRRGGPWELR